MLAHTLKHITTLVPEVLPMVKQASIEQEFPLDNKDSCLATALQVKYFEKIAYHAVDHSDLEKIAKAVEVYGLKDEVRQFTDQMVKAAKQASFIKMKDAKAEYLNKQAMFSIVDMKSARDLCNKATELYKEAKDLGIVPSDDVMLYSGNQYFNKMAAVKSLVVRFNQTHDHDFVKMAKLIVEAKNDQRLQTPEALTKIASMIYDKDASLGLQYRGFNFFKESMIKKASYIQGLTIRLANTDVPYSKFDALGKDTIASYIGKDVANEMDQGPDNFKQVAETLPLDLQRTLLNLTKNV